MFLIKCFQTNGYSCVYINKNLSMNVIHDARIVPKCLTSDILLRAAKMMIAIFYARPMRSCISMRILYIIYIFDTYKEMKNNKESKLL